MPKRYVHLYGNAACEDILEEYGLLDKGIKYQANLLKCKQCPNCGEGNKQDSRFCAKCKMVLTYDAYNETLENQKEKEDDLKTLKGQMQTILSALENIDESSKNQWAKSMVKNGIYKKQIAPTN
jgi:hypothetical protein